MPCIQPLRLLTLQDLDGNGEIDFEEFTYGMGQLDIMLTEGKVRRLFRYFDKDDGGAIDIDQFLAGIREPVYEEKIPSNRIECTYQPCRLAPGMYTNIELELSAEVK